MQRTAGWSRGLWGFRHCIADAENRIILSMATSSADFPDTPAAGSPASTFSLPDVSTGTFRSLEDLVGRRGTLVVFLCRHCPYVVHVLPKLAELALEFLPRGISTFGISANDAVAYPEDAPEKLRQMVLERRLPFPVLYDESQETARAYAAVCTPDIFLFAADRRLAYRGRLDASTPRNGVAMTGDDLRSALESVVRCLPVAEPWPPALGCSIKWKE
jgi:peroxiredoxin